MLGYICWVDSTLKIIVIMKDDIFARHCNKIENFRMYYCIDVYR